MQNPGEMQAFENVADWLRETTGANLEGVTLEQFRVRLSSAVEARGPQEMGVLAQVTCAFIVELPIGCVFIDVTLVHAGRVFVSAWLVRLVFCRGLYDITICFCRTLELSIQRSRATLW